MASLASTSILVHLVFADPLTWWFMRFLTGFTYAGLFIESECWLNDVSENETHGQMVAASSTLVLAVSIGSAVGAPVSEFAMNPLGQNGSFTQLRSPWWHCVYSPYIGLHAVFQ